MRSLSSLLSISHSIIRGYPLTAFGAACIYRRVYLTCSCCNCIITNNLARLPLWGAKLLTLATSNKWDWKVFSLRKHSPNYRFGGFLRSNCTLFCVLIFLFCISFNQLVLIVRAIHFPNCAISVRLDMRFKLSHVKLPLPLTVWHVGARYYYIQIFQSTARWKLKIKVLGQRITGWGYIKQFFSFKSIYRKKKRRNEKGHCI